MTQDKFSILNVTKIIEMIEDAKIQGYGDTEDMYGTLNELISILETADDVNKTREMTKCKHNDPENSINCDNPNCEKCLQEGQKALAEIENDW